MELRTTGMILICTCNLWMFIRFFQVGLQRKYWVKKGVFRLHIIPGTMLVWMSPYFVYSVWQNRLPNLWVATVAGVLGLSVCLTGFRMLMLLNRKDTRMKRWFFMMCVFMPTIPLTALSGIFFLQDLAVLADLGRLMALVSLIFNGFMFVIIALTLPSYFAKSSDLNEAHDDASPLPPFSWKTALELLHPKTDPNTRMYSVVGDSLFGRFLVWFFGDFSFVPIAVLGSVINWQMMTLPMSVILTSALRSVEFEVAFNLFFIGPVFWAIFEMTLFSRGYHSKLESWLSILVGIVAAPASIACFYPSWFNTDFVTGLFRGLFLHLPQM